MDKYNAPQNYIGRRGEEEIAPTHISMKGRKSEFERASKNDALVLYVHGKGGRADEAEHYKALFQGCDVVGLDYRASTPWEAREEFPDAFHAISAGYRRVVLIANSVGAYFAMCALSQDCLLYTI